jgi:hypothetical protein
MSLFVGTTTLGDNLAVAEIRVQKVYEQNWKIIIQILTVTDWVF